MAAFEPDAHDVPGRAYAQTFVTPCERVVPTRHVADRRVERRPAGCHLATRLLQSPWGTRTDGAGHSAPLPHDRVGAGLFAGWPSDPCDYSVPVRARVLNQPASPRYMPTLKLAAVQEWGSLTSGPSLPSQTALKS